MTGFKLVAAALILSTGMATPVLAQAQAVPGMQLAMAMPMHAGGKMARHGKQHMSHHATAKDGDRYGMK